MKFKNILSLYFLALAALSISESAISGPAASEDVAQTPTLVPHVATYQADIEKGISLEGTATRVLEKIGENEWKYSFNVKTTPADINESTTFKVTESGDWLSQSYFYELTGFFIKDRKQIIAFDQTNSKAHETYKRKKWDLSIEPGVLDRLNYQLKLQSQVSSAKTNLVYDVLHKGKLRTYTFAVINHERIQTAIGEKNAIVVEKVRDESKKRVTTLWFDAEAPYALLKMIQIEDSGEVYEINISKLEY